MPPAPAVVVRYDPNDVSLPFAPMVTDTGHVIELGSRFFFKNPPFRPPEPATPPAEVVPLDPPDPALPEPIPITTSSLMVGDGWA